MTGESEIREVVAGLKAQMDMMLTILKDIQKDIKLNYMPTAQIEDRFKSQGERTGRIEETLKTMDQDVKDKFTALALAAEKQGERKKDGLFKIIAAIGTVIFIAGTFISVIMYISHLPYKP